jgi:hypothetical protein
MRFSPSVTTTPSSALSTIALVRSLRAARPENCTRPMAKAKSPKTPITESSASNPRISGCAHSLAMKPSAIAAPTRRPATSRITPTCPGLSERSIAVVAVVPLMRQIRPVAVPPPP